MFEAGSRIKASWPQWTAYLLFLVVFVGVYFFLGTRAIYRENLDPALYGQQAYISAVYRTEANVEQATEPESGEVLVTGSGKASRSKSSLPHYSDGVVNPFYPWLLQGFSDVEPSVLFRKGKWLNLIVSAVFIVLLGLVAGKSFSFLGGVAILMLGGFGTLLERSTFFLPDTVTIILYTLVWVCVLSLMRQNSLWLYGLLGSLLGALFLADGRIWVTVIAFLTVSILRSLAESANARRSPDSVSPWSVPGQIVGLAVLVTAFMIVSGPRLSYSNTKFGNAFHLYSQYTMWLDSPAEADAFIRDHKDAKAFENISVVDRPGFVRYWKTKGASSLFGRIVEGVKGRVDLFFEGRIKPWFFAVLGMFLVIAFLHFRASRRTEGQVWRVEESSAPWVIAFVVISVVLTLLCSSISYPSLPADTGFLTVYLPLLVALIWIANRYRRQLQRTSLKTLVNRIYWGMLLLPVIVVSWRVFQAI